MAVNGVEIKAGQKWRTRDGRIVCVESVGLVGDDYPVVGFVKKTGSSRTYTLGGVFDIEGESKADLVELIEDAPVAAPAKPEIKVGQVWRMRNGNTFVVAAIRDQEPFPVRGVDGQNNSLSYSTEGFYSISGEGHAQDLVDLIKDKIDANELAAETLQSLGWHFVGNCWVQDAQPEQQSFTQTAADIEALSKVSVSVRKPNSEQQSALDVQVDGNHYKDCVIQPVEFIHANRLDFFQGNIIKYATRHKAKNGAADLRKAIHYCQLALQLQYGEVK